MRYSVSSIGTFLDCPKKFEYRYVQQREAIRKSQNLIAGTAVHAGLQAIKDGDPDYLDKFRGECQYLKPNTALIAEAMVVAWKHRYKDDGLVYVGNEREFKVNFDGIDFQGVFDGLCRDANGEWVLVEHKTTSSDIRPNSHYWNRLDINLQIDFYAAVATAMGYPISYILYDVIKIPGLKPKKALPPEKIKRYVKGSRDGKFGPGDPYPNQRTTDENRAEFKGRCVSYIADNLGDLLVREKVIRTPHDLDTAISDMVKATKLSKLGQFPRNSASCYKGPMHLCEYHPVCLAETTIDNPELYKIRTR